MSGPSRDAILLAASHLFRERGYGDVTVREIAAEAGVSAALVMKVFISKEKLYAAVQPDESLLAELDVPRSELGRTLVFRVLSRRERGLQEHWANISFAVRDSPHPGSARADTCKRYLAAISYLIGDGSADRRFAATVTALMIGLGESVRTLACLTP